MRSYLLALLILPIATLMAQDRIVDPFEQFVECYELRGGDKYMIQEEIIQRTHVLQAAYLASVAGAPEEVIIGMLVHDVGQVADADVAGDANTLHFDHDDRGARWLRERGFPERVWMWVQNHTLAKVILCIQEQDYFDHLSEASQISFHIQFEKYFSDPYLHYVEDFLDSPYADDFRAMRRCDDMAKIAGMDAREEWLDDGADVLVELPSFEHYREMVYRVLAGNGKEASDPDWREKLKTMHACMQQNRWAFEEAVKSDYHPNFVELRRRVIKHY